MKNRACLRWIALLGFVVFLGSASEATAQCRRCRQAPPAKKQPEFSWKKVKTFWGGVFTKVTDDPTTLAATGGVSVFALIFGTAAGVSLFKRIASQPVQTERFSLGNPTEHHLDTSYGVTDDDTFGADELKSK